MTPLYKKYNLKDALNHGFSIVPTLVTVNRRLWKLCLRGALSISTAWFDNIGKNNVNVHSYCVQGFAYSAPASRRPSQMLHPAAVPIDASPAPVILPATAVVAGPAVSGASGGGDVTGRFNASTNAANRRSLGNASIAKQRSLGNTSAAVATTGARSNNNMNVSSAGQPQYHHRRHHRHHHQQQQQQRRQHEPYAEHSDIGRTRQCGADVATHPVGPSCQYSGGLRQQQQQQQHYHHHHHQQQQQEQEQRVARQREQEEMRRKLVEWYQLHPHLSPVTPVRLPRPGNASAPTASSRRR